MSFLYVKCALCDNPRHRFKSQVVNIISEGVPHKIKVCNQCALTIAHLEILKNERPEDEEDSKSS